MKDSKGFKKEELKQEIKIFIVTTLIKLARKNKTITYSDLTTTINATFNLIDDIESSSFRLWLWDLLDEICKEENEQERPLLTAMVVQSQKGSKEQLPGKGFFTLIARREHRLPIKEDLEKENYFNEERRKVCSYWLMHRHSYVLKTTNRYSFS